MSSDVLKAFPTSSLLEIRTQLLDSIDYLEWRVYTAKYRQDGEDLIIEMADAARQYNAVNAELVVRGEKPIVITEK